MKHLKTFEEPKNLIIEGFDNKTIYKISISEKRLPELILNLVKVADPIKITDQYSINVIKIEQSTYTFMSKTFYITCTVSAPGHFFGQKEEIINGKKVFVKPTEDVRFEVKLLK